MRKNKLNLINSINSNLPSTISDSKTKERDNIKINYKTKPNTTTNRHEEQKKEKMKSRGKQIKNINIENNNNLLENVKFLKKNLKQVKTEGDSMENKITSIKISKVINEPLYTQKELMINNNKENNKRICTYKKDRINTYNYNTNRNNKKYNISSFDKRKKYIVPLVKNKKKKEIKTKTIKQGKKDINELKQSMKETKEILTLNLIKNKQIEYLKEYQKYIDDFNNKLYKSNEKKFRWMQEEGINLDELFIDNEENQNDTIDEIYEKEEGEEDKEDIGKESSI